MSTVDRHDTGAAPSGAATRDYVLSIKNDEGTLVARYFLYDCPVMLTDGERVEHFCFTDGAYGSVERILTQPPLPEYQEPPPPCQPIGCDNGIHLPGCPYIEVDKETVEHE